MGFLFIGQDKEQGGTVEYASTTGVGSHVGEIASL